MILGPLVTTFRSYGNSEISQITATEIQALANGMESVVTVKAVSAGNVIAEAPFQNNGFMLELPVSILPNLLHPSFCGKISDNGVETSAFIMLFGYNKEGYRIGSFFLTNQHINIIDIGNFESHTWAKVWRYADRDAVIRDERKISDRNTLIRDLDLKRGWNIVFWGVSTVTNNSVSKFTQTYQSQSLGDMNFSWRFIQSRNLPLLPPLARFCKPCANLKTHRLQICASEGSARDVAYFSAAARIPFAWRGKLENHAKGFAR